MKEAVLERSHTQPVWVGTLCSGGCTQYTVLQAPGTCSLVLETFRPPGWAVRGPKEMGVRLFILLFFDRTPEVPLPLFIPPLSCPPRQKDKHRSGLN